MKIKVTQNEVKIEKAILNDGEYRIHECEFELPEEFNGLVQKAVFWWEENEPYRMNIINCKCNIPIEVLHDGILKIGVYAFETIDDKLELRYSPDPDTIRIYGGSYVANAQNSEGGTPSEFEQLESRINAALNNIAEAIENAERLDVDATKTGNTATITITKQDGSQVVVNVLDGVDGTDGVSLQYNWNGTYLGIKRDDETNFDYVNLKGDTGEPGQIEFRVLNELPQIGETGIIYLIPLDTPETQENNYAEYIYVNNNWELLGKIGVHIDLSNYYTKQEVNNLLPTNLSDLTNDSDFTTKTYVDGLVGDINTALDSISGEVI